ncbi:MAG: hypothetical protein WCE48_04440 [Steroidobacteraceae bacterium]
MQKLDLARELALLVQVDATVYRSASFLDDRMLTPGMQGAWVPLQRLFEAMQQAPAPGPLHFIFHTGHVGSTLVSRLLDETGAVLSLREPLPLRTLADARDVLGEPGSLLSPEQFDRLVSLCLWLWGRPYPGTRCVVLKATSSTGRLAAPIFERHAAPRAIYLNLRAEPYLATLLAGENSPADLRGHGPGRLRRLEARIPGASAPLSALSLGELAALGWLVETWTQRDAAARFAGRILAVDFDEFLQDIPLGMSRILAHFDLLARPEHLAGLECSPVLSRYSKAPDHPYSPQLRAEVLADSRERNAPEIRRGLDWLQTQRRSHAAVAQLLLRDSG